MTRLENSLPNASARRGRFNAAVAVGLVCGGCLCPLAHGAPAAGSKAERLSRAADELFESIPYVRLKIELPNAELNKLRGYYWDRSGFQMDRPEALATVREGERVYTNVAVQLKGSAGSFRPIDDRPALTLNFDKFAKGQSFHGLDKISLNNSVQDESYLAEKISRELFHAAGVPVPRAAHATVQINQRRLGVYVLTEGWDGRFLRRYFSSTKGNFYDSGFKRDISDGLEVNGGENPEDHAPLRELVRAGTALNTLHRQGTARAETMEARRRWTDLEQILDVDRFLRMVVMETITGHWDGYTMNANNYRLFHDRASGRFVFMPHGMDQMFGASRRGRDFGGNLLWPRIDGQMTAAVLGAPEGSRRYKDLYGQLFDEVFDVAAITNRVQQIAAGLRPAFAESGQQYELPNWDWAVRNLCERITERGRSIGELLLAMKDTLRFDASNTARLAGWEPRQDYGKPTVEAGPDGVLQVRIHAGAQMGSWRTRVALDQGHYRLEGRAKVARVTADPGDSRAGAGLRTLGRGLSQRLLGDRDWTLLSHDFFVQEPFEMVVLICELRAGEGEAFFDPESLRLIRK